MMRILYVTTMPPSKRTGGGLHCYANLRALCECEGASVWYLGPAFNSGLEGLERINTVLARPFLFRDKVVAFVSGSATGLAGLYAESRGAQGRDFDVAFVESTRAGFAVKALARRWSTICCVHNVESDYLQSGTRGTGRVAAYFMRRSERDSISVADALLVMHRHDLARLMELYGLNSLGERAVMHPVCAIAAPVPVPYLERKCRVVIPGSLDEPFNERGILAFLRDAWPALRGAGAELIIAGRNPRSLLANAARRSGATLVANPASMADVVADSRLVVVPDLGGAGMKLRVAEALSLGVPVVGTSAGMLGYERVEEFGRAVPGMEQMAAAIKEVLNSPPLGARLAAGARTEWESRYSYPAFARRVQEVVARVGARHGASQGMRASTNED